MSQGIMHGDLVCKLREELLRVREELRKRDADAAVMRQCLQSGQQISFEGSSCSAINCDDILSALVLSAGTSILTELDRLRAENERLVKERDEFHRCLLARETALKNEGERWVRMMEERDVIKAENARLAGEVERLSEEKVIVDKVWKSLGISTYESAKPFTVWEHVENIKADLQRHKSLLDAAKQRIKELEAANGK